MKLIVSSPSSIIKSNYLAFDEGTYTQSIRIFGENLRTDFAQLWFGTKPQPSFSASPDGTYIDVDAPMIPFSQNLNQNTVKVRLQVNIDEEIYTDFISITYFRFEIETITVKCTWEFPISTSFPLECISGNDITLVNSGRIIRYQPPLLVESTTGRIR